MFVTRSRPSAGLSIIELLIGIAIGLFVLAGATMVASNQLTDNRKLLLETQIQQDLRAAMDIIARDLRRGGFWDNAYTSVGPSAAPLTNPYSPAGAQSSSPTEVYYTMSRNVSTADDNAVGSNEQNGFVLNTTNQSIDAQLAAGNLQALTDSGVVRITQFTTTVNTTPIDLPVCAAPPCPMSSPPSALNAACGGMSRILVRDVTITIAGEAVHDSSVKRSLVNTVRLRNDQVCQ